MTSSPKPTGTVAENDPSAPAVVLVTDAAAPVVVSADATLTDAPADVVPVTVVVADPVVAPEAGAGGGTLRAGQSRPQGRAGAPGPGPRAAARPIRPPCRR